MYAIVETGGKQYRVTPGDTVAVERLTGEPGETLDLARVLMVAGSGDAPRIGTPGVDGAVVRAEVLEHFRGEKIIVFRYKSKVRYRRKTGHRQSLTRVRITDILLDGASASKRAAAAEPAPPPAEAEPVAIATAEADPLVASEATSVVEREAAPDPIPMTIDDVEATSAAEAEGPSTKPETNQA